MKIFTKFILFTFSISLLLLYNLQSKEVEISSPFMLHYSGCVYLNDLIIVYGGSRDILISYDNGETWKQKNIFPIERVARVLIRDGNIFIFGNEGTIRKSSDNGLQFRNYKKVDLQKSAPPYDLVQVNNNYLYRASATAILLDNDFNQVKKIDLPSSEKWIEHYGESDYTLFKDNKIYIATDSTCINIYDSDLNYLDKFDDYVELYNGSKLKRINQIYAFDNKILISTIGTGLGANFNVVFSWDNLNNKIDTFLVTQRQGVEPTAFTGLFSFSIENDKILFPQRTANSKLGVIISSMDAAKNIDSSNFIQITSTFTSSTGSYRSIFKKDDRFILIGMSNSVMVAKYHESIDGINYYKEIESSFRRNSLDVNALAKPMFTDDFSILKTNSRGFLTKVYDDFEDESIFPLMKDVELEDGRRPLGILAKYSTSLITQFDEPTNKISLFVSENFGYSISRRAIATSTDFFQKDFRLTEFGTDPKVEGLFNDFCFREVGDKYINATVTSVVPWGSQTAIFKSTVYRFDKSTYTPLDPIPLKENTILIYLHADTSGLSDTTMQYFVAFNYYNKTNKGFFLYKSYNGLDSTTVEPTISYPNTVYLVKSKEVKYKGDTYFVYVLNDVENEKVIVDMINVKNMKRYSLLDTNDSDVQGKDINFDFAADKGYISINDELRELKGDLDNMSWEHYTLPYNGRINNYMYIRKDYMYVVYSDDNRPNNLYRIRIVDSISTVGIVKDNIEESKAELYSSKPYPSPAGNIVSVDLAWSDWIPDSEPKLEIFDIGGNKIDFGKIQFETTSSNKAKLIWECGNIPRGVYLLHIRMGDLVTKSKVILK